jgi:signal transduction histidine kinase
MAGKGTLRIKTGLSPTGKSVIVTVEDTGPGIPSEVLPHIFDPFYTTKENGKGTGLGLSVVYGVIENHGGRITACSAPGEGATFHLDLPLDLQTGSDAGGESGTVG